MWNFNVSIFFPIQDGPIPSCKYVFPVWVVICKQLCIHLSDFQWAIVTTRMTSLIFSHWTWRHPQKYIKIFDERLRKTCTNSMALSGPNEDHPWDPFGSLHSTTSKSKSLVLPMLLRHTQKIWAKKKNMVHASGKHYWPNYHMSYGQNLVHGERTSLSRVGPYRFCSGGTLYKPSWEYRFGYRFRVGPYRFCSDGYPTTLSILLWSYLILSDTHISPTWIFLQ